MLIVFILLLWVIVKQVPATKGAKSVSVYTAFLYVSAVLFFYNQAGISLSLGNFFLPITNFLMTSMIVVGSALAVGGFVSLLLQLFKHKKIVKSQRLTKRNWLNFGIASFLIFGGSLAYTSSTWAMNGIGNMSFYQIVSTLTQPLTGSEPGQIYAFILHPFLQAVLLSVPFLTLLLIISTCSIQVSKNKMLQTKHFRGRTMLMIAAFGLLLGLSLSAKEIGYADIKAYYFENTELYEDYYVDPKEVKLTFPEQKRNLIYIFLESTESSYLSTDVGGSQPYNLMPNLTQLAETEGIQFSNREQLGGMLQVPGANQTASSMAAQTSGLPLRPAASFGLVDGSGSSSAEYFPGAYSIGEILEDEGYNQTLLIGSKAEFAGREKYFQQHGNYDIRDYYWAIDQGLIPEDYYVWWGYEDDKLFDYAKDTLNELSAKEEPFNLTMLTADTHFEDGYATEDTPDLFGDQYSNVIYDEDRRIMAFLTWLKEQPYYENTTVILCGDHLTMDSDFFEDLAPNYQRSVYNVFLNTNKQNVNNKQRQFSAMDMFPTTLSALDVEIEGDRLALGTNLFSDKPTIIEKIGYDTFSSELLKRSKFYDENLIQNETDEESNSAE